MIWYFLAGLISGFVGAILLGGYWKKKEEKKKHEV